MPNSTKTKKTLFLFENGDDGNLFFQLEGDYSHLDNIFVGAVAPKGMSQKKHDALGDELMKLFFDENWERRETIKELDAPTKDWDHFVRCGTLP